VIPAETAALWQGSDEVQAAGVAAEQERRPWKLWWFVLLAALLIAVAESVFATRYLKVDRGAA
jgi:hypothetical protein